jgi:assimilatory nitrate reductase catalytic subunit
VEIGKRLKCGTNCGSCVPEIQALLGTASARVAKG